MRFVIFGAGALGGVVGGRLFEHGQDVVLIARGRHCEAIREGGLTLESSEGTTNLRVPAVAHPRDIELGSDDVVLVSVKSQDTPAALDALAAAAPPDVPVVCLQNGVANEPAALRLFTNVYGVPVMCPTAHLEPGVVQAYSSPVTGILDIGRYPSGCDETAEAIAAAFQLSTFVSEPRPDIGRWKWSKLIMNLGNAVEAACAPSEASGTLVGLARREGTAVLGAAGIEYASAEENRARRGDLLQFGATDGRARGGGSTWQSLARATGSVETDYLNGEIVLLGRLHGIPTPVNELLQRTARQLARDGAPPQSRQAEELLSDAERQGGAPAPAG